METWVTNSTSSSSSSTIDASHLESDIDVLKSTLPKEKGLSRSELYLYQSCWLSPAILPCVISSQRLFQAQQNDILIASAPKSGTTWLKALTFTILNRHLYPHLSRIPLLTSNPHDLVPIYEFQYPKIESYKLKSPRLYSTHLPYQSLSESIIKESESIRIIYICRNPYDVLISSWKFFGAIRDTGLGNLSLDGALDMFSRGVTDYGPIWDHVLGYWKESLRRPHNVLFLMYEELKEDIVSHIKRLAEFMGVPFSLEEEREGAIHEIAKLCSITSLRELDVNKNGTFGPVILNKTFFRKGQVGDWVNHLSPEMVERLRKVVQQKYDGSGIQFTTTCGV